jgi:hypothetical protein
MVKLDRRMAKRKVLECTVAQVLVLVLVLETAIERESGSGR